MWVSGLSGLSSWGYMKWNQTYFMAENKRLSDCGSGIPIRNPLSPTPLTMAEDALTLRQCGVFFPTVPSSVTRGGQWVTQLVLASSWKWASVGSRGIWIALRKNFLTLRMSNCFNSCIITFSAHLKNIFMSYITWRPRENTLASGPWLSSIVGKTTIENASLLIYDHYT